MTNTFKKIASLTLALCMCMSMASAVEIGTSGGSGSTPVSLTTTNDGIGGESNAPTKMSVTVPTALPMAMSDEGDVVTADNARITNNALVIGTMSPLSVSASEPETHEIQSEVAETVPEAESIEIPEESVEEPEPIPEPEPDPDPAPEPVSTSGAIGDSAVRWSLNTGTGELQISGSGDCDRFRSAEDQPWAPLRDQIREVWFYDMDALSISDLAYWFDGCTSLTMAEIPYTTEKLGTRAFANCPNLTDIRFSYHDGSNFSITPGAFSINTPTETMLTLISSQQYATHTIVCYSPCFRCAKTG